MKKYGGFLKYVFSVMFMIAAARHGSRFSFVAFGLAELLIIVFLTQTLMLLNKWAGRLVGGFLCLIYNAQYVSYIFAGNFLSRLMVDNVGSFSALGRRGLVGIGVAVLAVMAAVIPHPAVNRKTPRKQLIRSLMSLACVILGLILEMAVGQVYTFADSPSGQLIALGEDYYRYHQMMKAIEARRAEEENADGGIALRGGTLGVDAASDGTSGETEGFCDVANIKASDGTSSYENGRREGLVTASYLSERAKARAEEEALKKRETQSKKEQRLYEADYMTVGPKAPQGAGAEFWNEGVVGAYGKDLALPENPNIVLIFTEGLSQSIIDDDRNIMPNVRAYEEKSLNFTHYYNHTFATYRGIPGQLYSAYQMNNLDGNRFVSLTAILKDRGYHTTIISPEPNDQEFSNYLQSFDFDQGINCHGNIVTGYADLLDGEAYDLLWQTVSEEAKGEAPFFTVIYTVNTHVGKQDHEQRLNDSASNYLNKFYDCDYQFGEFMDKLEKSDMAKDTIVIFTTDHATYVETEFYDNFPDDRKINDLDEIPFFIYYPGITQQTVNAMGRNSLDMAPTVLDFLDISAENYFLGRSLFRPYPGSNTIETFFYDGSKYAESGRDLLNLRSYDNETDRMDILYRYMAAALK